MRHVRACFARLGSQSGFTIFEVMASILLLSVGLVAVAGSYDSATRGTVVAQRHEQAVSVAQREVERLKTVSYENLRHDALPVSLPAGVGPGDNTPLNPSFYVTGTSFQIKDDYLDSTSANRAVESLVDGGAACVVDPSSCVASAPENFTSGSTTGRIYRYITWRDEQCEFCTGEGAGLEERDSKRITVAVVLNTAAGGPGPAKPVYTSSVVADPDAQPPPNTPPPGPTVTAQQFFLYDTACAATTIARLPILLSHASHNTSQSGRNCSSLTKPDLAWNSAPSGLLGDPFFNLSTDVARPRNTGLGLMKMNFAGGNDCATAPVSYTSTEATDRRRKIHTWATNPFLSDFETPSTGGDIAFSLFTETVDGAPGDVTLCIQIRKHSALNTVLYRGEYRNTNWPTVPTQLPNVLFGEAQGFPQGLTVNQGDRLVVTMSVKSTSTKDVNLHFDHPAYPSLFTVKTTTPLP